MTSVEDTPGDDAVLAAAGALALCMVRFRDLLADDDYGAVLPHFEALTDALPAAVVTPALPTSTDPRDPAVVAAAASA